MLHSRLGKGYLERHFYKMNDVETAGINVVPKMVRKFFFLFSGQLGFFAVVIVLQETINAAVLVMLKTRRGWFVHLHRVYEQWFWSPNLRRKDTGLLIGRLRTLFLPSDVRVLIGGLLFRRANSRPSLIHGHALSMGIH